MAILATSQTEKLRLDRARAEAELEAVLQPGDRPRCPFEKAMSYAVLGQGQRIRPILAQRVARLAGADNELTLRAGAAVELLHCASLIVDDLPCMDNELTRRERPTAHVAYGEATALLAAFGLVALAARCVVEQRCSPAEMSSLIAFQTDLLRVLDASGLCEGQDLDLRLCGRDREQCRNHVIELKTVPLFTLAAKAGLMFTDPAADLSRIVLRFAREFGAGFQLVDDWLDGEVSDFGVVERQLERARAVLAPLAPAGTELEELIDYLYERSTLKAA
jgi:geranylgeranyl pyrophosphate synthase